VIIPYNHYVPLHLLHILLELKLRLLGAMPDSFAPYIFGLSVALQS